MTSEDPRIKNETTTQWDGKAYVTGADVLVCEEPLEVQIEGRTWVTVMRTPGDDINLARGLLFGEGVIASAEDIKSLRHCTITPSAEAEDNVLQCHLVPGVTMDWQGQERHLFASASCGVCGKASLENLSRDLGPLPVNWTVPVTTLTAMPDEMRAAQTVFQQTGGLHAAALFSKAGRLLNVYEDIGRHNATDKVIGWALTQDISFGDCVLVVSGRVSFEIAQKAWKASIPMVVAVSAASSLAVDVAKEANMGLMSFTRQGKGNCVGAMERFDFNSKKVSSK